MKRIQNENKFKMNGAPPELRAVTADGRATRRAPNNSWSFVPRGSAVRGRCGPDHAAAADAEDRRSKSPRADELETNPHNHWGLAYQAQLRRG